MKAIEFNAVRIGVSGIKICLMKDSGVVKDNNFLIKK